MTNPRAVNRPENIISEAPSSNLSPKKVLDNELSAISDANPGSEIRVMAQPYRIQPGRPLGVNYFILQDGEVVKALGIPNRQHLICVE